MLKPLAASGECCAAEESRNGERGFTPEEEPNNKWFGVSGASSSLSTGTCVSGRALIMCSTSINQFINTASVGVFVNCMPDNVRFTDCTNRSQAPPKCGAPGGLNVHFVSGRYIAFMIWSELMCFTASFSSRSAPTKFVPLSDRNSIGVPRRAMKLRMAMMQELVVILWAISMCTARTVRHVKSTPQRFSCLRPMATMYGPK
ncbi:uncharacterized protein LOC118514011 [Anopheles stephensi]|uniref:uncharacterized protein LOC118514011 n=1 Tax=Anopheles stephensi TaxID=30069 RepID=UPI0016589FC2|nr:uncharacterized protein LOC118514011 [Anopheles stephensi]